MPLRPALRALALVVASVAFPGCLEGDPSPFASDAAVPPDGASADAGASPGPGSGVPDDGGGGAAPRLCSGPSTRPVTLTFENAGARAVRVLWMNYECAEVPYADLAPGQRHEQPTFLGHPWRVRDRDTGALLRDFTPAEGGPLVVRVP